MHPEEGNPSFAKDSQTKELCIPVHFVIPNPLQRREYARSAPCHSESASAVPIYLALHLVIPNRLQRCVFPFSRPAIPAMMDAASYLRSPACEFGSASSRIRFSFP